QQLAAVLLVAALDRPQHVVAVEGQRLLVLDREQQGEGAEVAPGGDLGGGAVLERGRLQRAARFVEGTAQPLRLGAAAGRGPHLAALAGERPARRGRHLERVRLAGLDHRAEQLAAAGGVGGDDRRAVGGGQRSLERRRRAGGRVE